MKQVNELTGTEKQKTVIQLVVVEWTNCIIYFGDGDMKTERCLYISAESKLANIWSAETEKSFHLNVYKGLVLLGFETKQQK